MYVPPYRVIARALGLSDQESEASGGGWISDRFLRFLMEKIVSQLPFNEDAYLNANPDVATAIATGGPGPHEHYVLYGYFEEREGAGPKFDEAYYLRNNPDVAAAVKAGDWPSGWHHYRRDGMFEWRSPSADAEQDLNRWREMLAKVEMPAMAAE